MSQLDLSLEALSEVRSRNEQRKANLPTLTEDDLRQAVNDCDRLLAEVVSLRVKLAHLEGAAIAAPHVNSTRANHISS